MQFERQRRATHAINLTPLIDVIFQLIVYLMVTTSFIEINSIELSLPNHAQEQEQVIAAANARDQDIMLIDIGANDALYLNTIIISINDLEDTLRTQLKNDKERQVLIRAADDVNVQQLVDVMDMVHLAGGRRVSVDTWQDSAMTSPAQPSTHTKGAS